MVQILNLNIIHLMSRMHLLSALAMDLKIRIKVIQPYYSNGKSPAATFLAYKTVHDVGTDYFNLRSIERLVQRFEETGSASDKSKSDRPSLEEERQRIVGSELESLRNVDDFNAASCRSVSSVSGM